MRGDTSRAARDHGVGAVRGGLFSNGNDRRRSLKVELQRARRNFLIGHSRRAIVPAIGVGHRNVERLVRMREPSRTFVVEIGQSTLPDFFFVLGLGDDAVRVA